MCVLNRRCYAWISIAGLEGCLRNPSTWLDSRRIPCYQPIDQSSVYIDRENESLVCVRNLSHGALGNIDLAVYRKDGEEKYVYVKRPIIVGQSLLQEAAIQQLVSLRLDDNGFINGASRVLCVFALRDRSVGFAMEPIQGAVTFDRYLNSISDECLPNAILDCLVQLCAIGWYLDQQLGVNHRDLSPCNFMVVDHSPRIKILTIENEIIDLSSSRSLTLIDFGFSCIGDRETHVADLSLSTVYPKNDPCPKEGRDLYLFLGLLYIDYHSRFPPQLHSLFESWLQPKFCKFMRSERESAKQWLYVMVGNSSITRLRIGPVQVINDLEVIRGVGRDEHKES